MRLTVQDLLNECADVRLERGAATTVFDGGFVDSRAAVPGGLFVGIAGEHTDGGLHAPDAAEAGAAAVVLGPEAWETVRQSPKLTTAAVLVADDPGAVLRDAGRLALERVGARVVAVTGSVGKTTTKDILVALLNECGQEAHGTPGNHNTEIGVPLALLAMPNSTRVAVVEMGMRGAGQIAELTDCAPPDVACITSIAPVHLELLGTMEAVAAAKAEVFTGLRAGGVAVVPADEPLLAPHLAALREGVRVVRFDELESRIVMNLGKDWQRRNAAAAVACCDALKVDIPGGLHLNVGLSAMRGQEYPLDGGGVLIEDCYNANPVAMKAALADLATHTGRRVAILGDMFELGGEERRFHRDVGGLVSMFGIERLIAIGERASAYVEGAEGTESTHFETVEAAVEALPGLLKPGDTVLVKASRGMALERVSTAIREFAG